MRFLVDANILIAIEPFSGTREYTHAAAARFYQLLHEQSHQLFTHPAVRDDLMRTKDDDRRAHNLAALGKYPMLSEAPIATTLRAQAGDSEAGTNDHRDLRLLAAVERSAVECLVTEDVRLKRRANRAGLADSVLGLAEAVSMLEAMMDVSLDPLPFVTPVESFALDESQRIFDSIRSDYPEFDQWMAKKVRPDAKGRRTWVVLDPAGEYRAIALVKRREVPGPLGLTGEIAKLTTFKVDAASSGLKLGELLLKEIFRWAHADGVEQIFVEVHDHLDALIGFLGDFGFHAIGATGRAEIVLSKRFTPGPNDIGLSDLQHHIEFGPPSLRPTQQLFVVPVIPAWFDQLFPESVGSEEYSVQPTLAGLETEPRPVGSAIRKAYLSNSRTTLVNEGDLVSFYRSHAGSNRSGYLYSVGIVEKTFRSSVPQEIMEFVGVRTVYTPSDIEAMARRPAGVLAIMFRQDRLIEPTIPLEVLLRQQVLSGPPQSITRVSNQEGQTWLINQILASP